MPPRVLIAIPAFNEAQFIGALLEEVSAYAPVNHILVVNDGSTDRTADIASSFGSRLINHKANYGKGRAIETVFSFAHTNGFDWIIFLDGDGQHPPYYLPEFLKEIRNGRVDVVLGNRQSRTDDMPIHRRLSNGMTSVIISLCAGGVRILDSQCGFRAVRLSWVKGLEFKSKGFQVESEMLLKLGKLGASFAHIPITTVYGKEASSINLVSDTLKFVKLILKSFWW